MSNNVCLPPKIRFFVGSWWGKFKSVRIRFKLIKKGRFMRIICARGRWCKKSHFMWYKHATNVATSRRTFTGEEEQDKWCDVAGSTVLARHFLSPPPLCHHPVTNGQMGRLNYVLMGLRFYFGQAPISSEVCKNTPRLRIMPCERRIQLLHFSVWDRLIRRRKSTYFHVGSRFNMANMVHVGSRFNIANMMIFMLVS